MTTAKVLDSMWKVIWWGEHLQNERTGSNSDDFFSGLWSVDPHSCIADLDPAVFLNADLEPDQDPAAF